MEGTGFPRPGGAGRLPPARKTTSTSSAPPRSRWPRTTPTRSSTRPSCRCATPGYSPSYRREAGAHGKDTRGIFRVHWFDKVEMFVFCAPEDAAAEHQRLLAWEKEFIDALEIPFQVLELASGDLGLSAARKYDCYGWLPTQDRYREITSTSNCTEFQARRLNIRARFDGRHRAGGHAERHAVRDDPDDHHDLGEPPAGRRLRTAAARPAPVPRWPRGADARSHDHDSDRRSTSGWRPRLVAFDVDGTLVDRDDQLPGRGGRGGRADRCSPQTCRSCWPPAAPGTAPASSSTGSALPPGPAVCSNGAVIVSYPPRADREGDHLRPARRDRPRWRSSRPGR